MSRLVVIGAGDVGGRVAARWVAGGHGRAIGITRTTERHHALGARGVEPTIEPPIQVLRPDDRVLLSVSGSEGQLGVASDLPRLVGRAVMTSSTGFYGSRDGSLGPHSPPGEGARAAKAVRAEAAFRAVAEDGVILRFGGLYRRGRGPQEALRRRGAPLPGPAERALPLIHIDDAASAALAALLRPAVDPVYVGVVGRAPSRRSYYTLACELLGLAEPTFEGSALQRSFDASSLRRDLLPKPRWPDWSEGLRAALHTATPTG